MPNPKSSFFLSKNHVLLLATAAVGLAAFYFTYLLRGELPRPHSRQLLGLCFLAVAARPWLKATELRQLLLALSVIGCVAWARVDCLGIFAFAAFVTVVSRSRMSTRLRVTLVMLLWFGALLPKLWLTPAQILEHAPLMVYWAGIPFSALYLVVERARGSLEDATWADDALYLLALPRLTSPFIQAIPASTFFASQKGPELDPKLALRGAGLLIYGAALFVLMAKFPYIHPPRPHAHTHLHLLGVLPRTHNFVFVYAANASAIFCAVGMFRLMGFDLSSGFRTPLLSKSFAEFYRRWNHYVYDSVKSLFLFPLLGWTRTFLPNAAAAVLSAYLAIFLGSFCASGVLAPLAVSTDLGMVLKVAFDPQRLLILAVFWSLIILPQLLPHRTNARPPTFVRGLARRLVFLGLLWGIARVAQALGVVLM